MLANFALSVVLALLVPNVLSVPSVSSALSAPNALSVLSVLSVLNVLSVLSVLSVWKLPSVTNVWKELLSVLAANLSAQIELLLECCVKSVLSLPVIKKIFMIPE